jgi:hypothetical protein
MGYRLFDISARLFVLAFAMTMLLGLLMTIVANAAPLRDLVFVDTPPCKGDRVDCARAVYFNGDWQGVELCKGTRCRPFEEVFK